MKDWLPHTRTEADEHHEREHRARERSRGRVRRAIERTALLLTDGRRPNDDPTEGFEARPRERVPDLKSGTATRDGVEWLAVLPAEDADASGGAWLRTDTWVEDTRRCE